jgi:pilus assembly protein CpaB
MVFRVAFFLLTALNLVAFGTVAWLYSRPAPAAQVAVAPVVMAKVLVAARPIRAGSLIKPEDLAGKEIPKSDADADANPDDAEARRALIGAMVRKPLAKDDPLNSADVVRPGDHGFLAAVLQPGKRAVTLGVDAVTGSAGLIWPGDKVDLILTQAIADQALPAGRRVAAETVLSDVRVIAIDQKLVQGSPDDERGNKNSTVTLEVSQSEAERVSVAAHLGKLSLSVRSADMAPVAEVSGPATTWALDVSPALAEAPEKKAESVVRVFQGAAEAKEFKF